MIKLFVDVYGEEETILKFHTELEVLNWLIDAGFKTHVKSSSGNLYRREKDAAYARTNFQHVE